MLGCLILQWDQTLPVSDPTEGYNDSTERLHSVLNFGEENDLPWGNLISVCTDGAPSMLGRQAGFVALFRQAIGKPNLIPLHYTGS